MLLLIPVVVKGARFNVDVACEYFKAGVACYLSRGVTDALGRTTVDYGRKIRFIGRSKWVLITKEFVPEDWIVINPSVGCMDVASFEHRRPMALEVITAMLVHHTREGKDWFEPRKFTEVDKQDYLGRVVLGVPEEGCIKGVGLKEKYLPAGLKPGIVGVWEL